MAMHRLKPAKLAPPGPVVVLVYDGLCLFEFGIASELFGLPRPELEVPWYPFSTVAIDPKVNTGIGQLHIHMKSSLRLLDKAETIVVPGWKGPAVQPSKALRAALLRANQRGARFLSICSGAFLLGWCGLLDGRRATTHWRYEDAFRTQFPDADLVPDVLYVEDGNVITSAGSAAGIDAGLQVIRTDYGVAVANQVAKRLVVPAHRGGGQRQYIPTPVPKRQGGRFDAVFDWARENLHRPIGAADLAQVAAMSERNFFRRFRDQTGQSPSEWLLQERIERAKTLLEVSDESLARIADSVGLGSMETLRGAFRRRVGVPPTEFRRAFRHR